MSSPPVSPVLIENIEWNIAILRRIQDGRITLPSDIALPSGAAEHPQPLPSTNGTTARRDNSDEQRPRRASFSTYCSEDMHRDRDRDNDAANGVGGDNENHVGFLGFFRNLTGGSQRGRSSAPAPSVHPPICLLPAREMAVIRALFSYPGWRNAPKKTKWTEFVHTMEVLGFRRVNNHQGGSTQSFVLWRMSDLFPPGSEGWVFTQHQPHPKHTFNLDIMRRIGYRLNKKFGWSAATFGQK
ncbi:hypothetical protein F4808DRAFT_475302 [Astrocystis sublimbata]|nr:hypothetical protein F4808DRAFT_475302 [Astrocystis sublimbata]